MAETQAQAYRPPDEEGGARPETSAPADNGQAASPPGATPKPLALVLAAVQPGDDVPTIISKNTPPKSDPGLADGLRGRVLAHFELIEPIGAGGMAAVIRARDTQLDRVVALKVLPPEMAADPEHVRRFQNEARSAARLDHENIARVFYCGQDQGLLFIAFEFVEGQNLHALLERRGRLPVTEAIHYVLQIATGLAHAAERGVVHRDIKPSNIIVTPSGRAKLVDMGLARTLGPQADGVLTQSGVTLGTFDYISPEQALEPREADVRSDIYSLGCTFYHMLTGQPPVPEGTAAKKLHCHQHVAPVDPRQLNPAIPDDVAATLARMMAKDPRERYQQPEHLVQHLLVLAQKAGAWHGCDSRGTAADGVLFVDAPLPAPPQMRPAFLMGAAVVLLVAFVVLIGAVPGPNGGQRPHVTRQLPKHSGDSPPTPDKIAAAKAGPAPEVEQPADVQPPLPAVEPPWYTPANVRELIDYLDRTEVARVALADHLDLEGAQLQFVGRSLEMKAADPKTRPTIRLDYPASGGQRWVALTIRGDSRVTLTGLRFVVNATQAPDLRMAAVAHQGTGQVSLTRCEFVQLNPPDPVSGRLSSVTVTGPRGSGDVPRLNLAECYFAPGQEAVTLSGATDVRVTDCAFAPHSTALFHLRGRGKRDSVLMLHSCTAMLTEGPAFRLTDGPLCTLNVKDSAFARLDSPATPSGAPGFLLHTGQLAPGFEYTGNENCFHNLRVYGTKVTDGVVMPITTLKDFNREEHFNENELSVELADSPWEARDPLSLLAKAPVEAFRLKANVRELRRRDGSNRLVGVNASAWGNLYKDLPPLEEPKPEAVAGRRYVDPSAPVPAKGIYATLKEAVAAAKSGDEIVIRATSPLRVSPISIQEPNFTLIISAGEDPKVRPVLILNRPRVKDEDSLFKLFDGQLTLKGLSIQLEAGSDALSHQSVVTLHGPAQCTLQDCLVTLQRGASGTESQHLAVVTLADPNNAMKMETRSGRTMPDVDLAGCFLRGDGDLLTVRSSRPFALDVRNSLVVLRSGALLNVEGGGEDQSGQTDAQTVSLSQVTTYLGEHLVTLKATRHARGLLKTEVTAHDCLFAAAGGKSLVHLEGMDSERQVSGLLSWRKGEKANVYSGFSPLLDQVPRNEDAMPMPPYDRTRWGQFTGEGGEATFKRAQFSAAPAAEEPWTKVTASHFRLKPDADLPRCGADIEELVKRFDPGTGTAGGAEE